MARKAAIVNEVFVGSQVIASEFRVDERRRAGGGHVLNRQHQERKRGGLHHSGRRRVYLQAEVVNILRGVVEQDSKEQNKRESSRDVRSRKGKRGEAIQNRHSGGKVRSAEEDPRE